MRITQRRKGIKMLKIKNVAPGNIVSVKILNGDELIARLKEEFGDTVILSNPMVFTMTPEGPGVIPWFALGDGSLVTVKKSHIFSMVNAKLEATQEYADNMSKLENA